MSEVDQRVVQMQFDNQKFESGIQTTLKSLDSLNKSLKMTDSAKGFSQLNQSVNSISLEPLISGVEAINQRFSAMGIAGITAIQNIANTAVNAGKRIVNALTLEPVMTGFSEYETKMNAITTILTNTQDKGTTLDDVIKTLDELNEYADLTIYNFAQMTRNVGTFTAAGVDLETSAKAIKGIANLAAGSGSSAQQASTAMYQLSQAIAAGRVSLQDWNSVVNAGMGGQLFQNALKETAKEMGVVIDESKSFRESISAQSGDSWLTSDILVKTLEKFADDESLVKAATEVKTVTQLFDTMKESVQSGWAKSWEYIIGDKDEATKVLTDISDAFNSLIGPSTDARNAALEMWNNVGGRDRVITGMTNAIKALGEVITPIKDAFREMFPPITGRTLIELSIKFRNFTEQLKPSEELISNISRTFKGLFAILDLVKTGFSLLAKAAVPVLGLFGKLLYYVLDGTAVIGDYAVALNKAVKGTDFFEKAFKKLQEIFDPAIKGIKAFYNTLKDVFSEMANVDTSGIDSLSDRVATRFQPLTKIGELVGKAFEFFSNVLKKAVPIFYSIASVAKELFDILKTGISNFMDSIDFDASFNTFLDIFNTGVFAVVFLKVKEFFEGLKTVSSGGSGILNSIKSLLDGVRGCLEAWQSSIKANVLLKIAGAVGILAASLLVLSLIDSDRLSGALISISVLFTELIASLTIFQKIAGDKGFKNIQSVSKLFLSLSASVLILSFAVAKLASLSWEDLAKGLIGSIALIGSLVATSVILSKTNTKMVKASTGLVIFAVAIRVLAESVEAIGALDIATIGKGMLGISGLLLSIGLFMKATNKLKVSAGSAASLILVATSLRIMSGAVKSMGSLDTQTIENGLLSIAGVLASLAIFIQLTNNSKGMLSIGTSMVLIAASMLIFSKALTSMGSLSTETIGKGLLSLSGALMSIAISTKIMPKNMVSIGLGLLAISSAILILSSSLTAMGKMSMEEIGRGLLALSISLLAIVSAMNLAKTAVSGAAAFLIMAGAIAIFVPMLKLLGGMSLTEIGLSLLTLAGAFTVIGVAGLLLGPLVPVILSLSGALALFGVSILAVGVGVLAFATGMATLAVSGTAGSVALVTAITSILGLLPVFIKRIGDGIIALAASIRDGAPIVAGAIVSIITSMLSILAEQAPIIVESIMAILDTFLEAIIEYTPKFLDYVAQLIIDILGVLVDKTPDLIAGIVGVIVALLKGIGAQLPVILNTVVGLVIDVINGVAEAIRTNTAPLIDALGNVAAALLEAALTIGAQSILGIFDLAARIIQDGFIGGVISKVSSVLSTFSELLGKIVSSIGTAVSEFFSAGANLISGFINGIKSKIGEAVDWAGNLANSALDALKGALGIASPAKKAVPVGEFFDLGFVKGIQKFADRVSSAAGGVGDVAVKSLKKSMVNLASMIDSDMEYHPTITPVLDLSGVKNADIGGILNKNTNLQIGSISGNIGKIHGKEQSAYSDRPITNITNNEFVQNNNSPKALSRIEIYRQSKNLFSASKGPVRSK